MATLETPARIVAEATGPLHMVQPSQTVQLPHVPLDKPLPTPTVAAAPAGPSTAAGATASTAPSTSSTATGR